MVRQEISGYLLTHDAISALICQAATEADIDPDRIKFTRTVRLVRRRLADPTAFPLTSTNDHARWPWPHHQAIEPQPETTRRTYPPTDIGIRHHGPRHHPARQPQHPQPARAE